MTKAQVKTSMNGLPVLIQEHHPCKTFWSIIFSAILEVRYGCRLRQRKVRFNSCIN